ncbi:hypothetical protein BDW22DRAFT_1362213 [Trametopsis cervina]|nr:hypothetical protein BDW22DRAFT_1362213 [Trametopsis cervina]
MTTVHSAVGESESASIVTSPKAPNHLNSAGCYIRYVEGKGRGVFAQRDISPHTTIEISPVLLFTPDEYREHGRHTVLDHYTFKWKSGQMALALGLGSLFNHSEIPNVSYKLDPETESIIYTTTRHINSNEELCIFYGHSLWFQPSEAMHRPAAEEEPDNEWGGLSRLEYTDEEQGLDDFFLRGDPNELISEDALPFVRLKLIDDEAEDEINAVQTEPAWVVDIPDPKHTGFLLKWLKQSGYDTPSFAHLKRIRKTGATTTLLVSPAALTPDTPRLPSDMDLPEPYILEVPRSAALTQLALKNKTTFWPTIYAPRKKYELEPWSRAKVRWAWEAMRAVIKRANAALVEGQLPIVAHVPVPFDETTRQTTQITQAIAAHDTRVSTSHPLRHAVLSLVRSVVEQRTKSSVPSSADITADMDSAVDMTSDHNGAHYLLTSLTLFMSHEPCIMCSMALLHSRVKEVFYLIPMEKTGGCGGATCLPRLPGVNHRFGIAQWKPSAFPLHVKDWAVGEEIDA